MTPPRTLFARSRGVRAAVAGREHDHAHDNQGSVWLTGLSVGAILLLLLLTVGLLLAQRDASLERAQAQTKREVQRLANELEQSLRMAQASIEVAARSTNTPDGDLLGDHRPLVQSLALPFELHRSDAPAGSISPASPGQWLPGLPSQTSGRWYVPLTWVTETDPGTSNWEVRLSRDALLSRFASEQMPTGSAMSLFRIEDDGATTVLARYPYVESEQGHTFRGHLAVAAARSPSGVFEVPAQLDGIPRIVGYQQLAAPGQRLLIAYGLGVEGVLATWNAILPWAILLTVLVAAAMAWGAWRLDRSVRDLRRSERHFQTLANHLPDVVSRYDRDGRLLYVNPAIEAANGLKPEAMIGRMIREIGALEPIATVWLACLERVFDTGQEETLCFSYPGPDGLQHWEAQVRLEPPLPGEQATVLVLSRNVTERTQAEQQRLSAQQLFETVFQTAPEAMSLSDRDTGSLLLVNDAFCELFGRSREELIGTSSVELGLWKYPQERDQMRQALMRGEAVRDAEGVGLRPDGRTIDVRFSAERVLVDGQERLLLMFRDVTESKRALQALARNEMRLRLASAQGQVWEWDFEGGDFSPSREFFVRLGHDFAPEVQLDQAFGEVAHPEDIPRLRWLLHRFFKGESGFQMEFRARDAHGSWHWFDAQGSGLRDASGRVTYMAGTAFEITDRKALEEAQRQTLKHLKTVTDASSALFWTSDANKRCDWISQRWLDMTGTTLEQELGDGWLRRVHPDDLEHCMRAYEEAFEEREPYTTDYRELNAQGEYRWLLEQGTPRYDADNRFIGYIGSCLDITDLKQAQASARERGAVLEQVFDVLQDMLFVVDGQDRFVFHQAGRGDRLYRPPQEFIGKTLAEVLPPDLATRLREAMDLAWTAGMQEIDYELDLPGGQRHFTARLAWLPGGDQCMFLVRDTSDQQTAHRERERLNEFVLLLFRLANRFINLPVQETDAAINEALGDMGRFVDADRAYLFDYDFATETGSNTHEWCAEGVSPEIDNLQNLPFELIPDWINAHIHGRVMHVQDVQALPEGPLHDFLEPQGIKSLMALPLIHGKRCMGFVGLDSVRHTHNYGQEETTLLHLFAQMLVNIRLRLEAEERIRELTEGLEHKVAERTAQLEDSVRQLTTVNRELESFTYSASHDLRTPLRGIEGFSSLLLQDHADQLDAQGLDYLGRIQKATLHMSQLVSDLLAYSRLQHMTQRIEPMDLQPFIEGVVRPFQDEMVARMGHMQMDVPASLFVRADAQGLGIVLRNLIDNALKFTPADRAPQIHIAAHEQEGLVHLQVSDNGIGFDMQHHDRIFGMFQRLHRQDQIPGTGIGLAMVKKAVTRMGGRIRAESARGQGARFYIELPASDPSSDNTQISTPPAAGSATDSAA